MFTTCWVTTPMTAQHKNDKPSPEQIQQWSALKLFYRQHMSYARISLKESIAVMYENNASITHANMQSVLKPQNKLTSTVSGVPSVTAVKIVAAVRIKHVGQYQLISGLLVAPDNRHKGLATKLLHFIAPTLVIQKCFLFTHSNLQRLYQQQQFNTVPVQDITKLPADIVQLYRRYHHEARPLVIMQLQQKP
ncbi:hypothetical protein ACNH6B_15645 [Shewanella basaltis]|uniref:hypothetical protein n=1 Tax=Shewanella basaltis TaxID=472183 RepID=UPI003AB03B3F